MDTKPRIRVPAGGRYIAPVATGTLRRQSTAFDAGQNQRRLRMMPTATQAINTLIRRFGRTIVARSRYLCANNPYAANAKDVFVAALAGTGIKPSPLDQTAALKKQMNLLWYDWCDECDADGLTDFYGIQNLVAGEIFEAGECFVRFRSRYIADGYSVPMQLQVIPSEMLDLSHNTDLGNGNRIESGIQFNPIGQRVGYHFWKVHPYSDQGNLREKTFVPASEVMHVFKPRIAGQIRGLPHTLPAITKLAMLDAYDDAELERKRTAALYGGFVTRKQVVDDEFHPLEVASDLPGVTQVDSLGTQQDVFGTIVGGQGVGLEPGAFVDLAEGEDVTFSEPADVGGNYEAFQFRTLLSVCSGLGVPYADGTGDLRGANYGSIRAGLVQFRRRMESAQHHMMIFQLCRPTRLRWMQEAVMAQKLAISPTDWLRDTNAYTRCKWIPPKWDWIDPLKDRQAEKIAVDEGFKPRSDVVEAEGFDPEENDARILEDQEREQKLNIKLRHGGVKDAIPADPTEDPAVDPPPDPTPPAPYSDPPPRQREKPINVHVTTPVTVMERSVKKRTIVTKHDAKGRVLEFEQEEIK